MRKEFNEVSKLINELTLSELGEIKDEIEWLVEDKARQMIDEPFTLEALQ